MPNKRVLLTDPFYDKEYHNIFNLLYTPLCNYCYLLINNFEAAEDLVQDQFVNLWENWERLKSINSIKGYLFTSIKNRSINYIKQQSKLNDLQLIDNTLESLISSNIPLASEMIENTELEKIIEKGIQHLPSKCRTIFILKRIDEMSNQEIAGQLDISVKTVEAQMTIALKRLYNFLSEHWEFILLLCAGLPDPEQLNNIMRFLIFDK